MSLLPLRNSFEGGSAGTTLTQGVGGNTGGASGDFFDTITIGGTATFTFDSGVARDTLSGKIVQPATGSPTSAGWSGLGSITTDVWTRHYFQVSTVSVADIMVVFTTAAASSVCYAGFSSAGKIQITNGAGSSIAALLGSFVLATNTWYRLEVRVIPSTTVGVVEWRLYLGDSPNLLDTKAATGQVLGGANIDKLSFGHGASSAQTPFNGGTGYLDDIAASSVGWIGPTYYQYTPSGQVPLLMSLSH